LKSKEEDQEKRAPSQEDESVRPHDLEIIHPSSQTKPKISLKIFFSKCLTLLKQIRKPHQSLSH
jgi:hypothetical protein